MRTARNLMQSARRGKKVVLHNRDSVRIYHQARILHANRSLHIHLAVHSVSSIFWHYRVFDLSMWRSLHPEFSWRVTFFKPNVCQCKLYDCATIRPVMQSWRWTILFITKRSTRSSPRVALISMSIVKSLKRNTLKLRNCNESQNSNRTLKLHRST